MAMTDYTSKLVATGKLNYGNSSETVKLYVAYKSTQNVSANTSTVYCGMYIVVSGGWSIGAWGDSGGSYVGTTALTFNGAIPASTSGTYWLVENKSFTVNHNADGSGSTSIAWKWGVNSSWGSMVTPSGSFTYTLPTIPRASTITATNSYIEYQSKITINRASSNFTHTLQYKVAGQTSYTNIVSKTTATSYNWTLPTAIYDYVSATGKTVNVSINCITYNGSTKIGEYAKTIVATCYEAKCKPTLAPTIKDTGSGSTALTGDVNKVIKYYNLMSYTIGATAKNGATIKSQKITCGSKSATAASGTLSYVDSNVFTITATDSRGFTNTTTVTKTLVDYIKPTCRLNATATLASNNTATVNITIDGDAFNGSFGAVTNELLVQYRYKTDSGSFGSWTSITATKSGNKYTATKALTGLSYTSTYTIEAKITDSTGNSASGNPKSVSAKPVFEWGKNEFIINADYVKGNVYSLYRLVGIPADSDLNNYRTPGVYAIASNANAGSIANMPDTKTAGKLIVSSPAGTTISDTTYKYVLQEFIPLDAQYPNYKRLGHSGSNATWVFDSWYRDRGSVILWSGLKQMTAAQTITLTQPISLQPNGVVFRFVAFDKTNSTSRQYHYNEYFVPKEYIKTHNGLGHTFAIWGNGFNAAATKYLYIYDTEIKGNDTNNTSGTATTGIKFDNTAYVLCEVIGV